MSYSNNNRNTHLPDRARLGLGTLDLLAQIQTVESGSVDALVARAIALYYRQHLQRKQIEQEQKAGDTNGQEEKGTVKH